MMWAAFRSRRKDRPALHQERTHARFDVADAVRLDSRDQLDALSPGVSRGLSDEFKVEGLAARLCPVLLSDHSVALFALAEHVGSDQADELLRRVVAKGYALATPTRYILDAPLLLAVARNQLFASPSRDAGHGGRHSRTALAAAFQDLVEWGVRHGASDLHLNVLTDQPESEVKYTIGGRYVTPQRFRQMPTPMLADMLAVVWMDIQGGNGALFDPHVEQQGSLVRRVDDKEVVIRWASLAADNGPSVCLRLLVRHIISAVADIASLGYLDEQVAAIERVMLAEGGAIVLAGTVGSGKSTTLATLVSQLPAHRKIITVEDPVEYRIPNAIQNTVVRVLSESQPQAYSAKLRTLKRSAMTDVLLGEIRDQESGQAFMDLAGSGVNVYTTVHAPSAASVPDRLASDFIGISRDFLLTPGALRLIIFQALLPRLCTTCSLPVTALDDGACGVDGRFRSADEWVQWLDRVQGIYRVDISGMRIRNTAGCEHCGLDGVVALKGYAGRTVAAELIEPELQTDFLESLRSRRSGVWLQEQARQVSRYGLDSTPGWRSAMDAAMLKALKGEVDPRDVEVHFQAFDTRWQYGRMVNRREVSPLRAVQ